MEKRAKQSRKKKQRKNIVYDILYIIIKQN